MARLTWTPQAIDDVDAICKFIARDSPQYARLFAMQVFKSVERLEVFLMSGRVIPEVEQEDIREIVLGNYRLIYRILSDGVEILTIYHSARLFDSSKLFEGP